MTSSIPAETDDEKARVAKLKKMEAGKVAPLAVYLASDAAAAVNAQVFAVRANEIMLMSQPRPLRATARAGRRSIGEIAMPDAQAFLCAGTLADRLGPHLRDAMPLDYATVKDWRFDEVRQRYDEKRHVVCPGHRPSQDPEDERQLRYVYERDLLAFPTMSVVLGYPGFWVRPAPASTGSGRARRAAPGHARAAAGLRRDHRPQPQHAWSTRARTGRAGDHRARCTTRPAPAYAADHLLPGRRRLPRRATLQLRIAPQAALLTGSTRTAIRCTPIPRWRG